jgi:hypothetical protein
LPRCRSAQYADAIAPYAPASVTASGPNRIGPTDDTRHCGAHLRHCPGPALSWLAPPVHFATISRADQIEEPPMNEIAMTILIAVMIAIAMVLFASIVGAHLRHARERHTIALAGHRAVAPWRRRRPF